MISLFAFIVTLGIIVDDAIVVGENIYEKRERGMPASQAAVEGAQEIATPVIFAVLTNIVAFAPLFFVPGASGKLYLQIPAVAVSVLAISLIGSLFILPAHLSHPMPGWLRIVLWPYLQFMRVVAKIDMPHRLQRQHPAHLCSHLEQGAAMAVLHHRGWRSALGGHPWIRRRTDSVHVSSEGRG